MEQGTMHLVHKGDRMEIKHTIRVEGYVKHVVQFSNGQWGVTNMHDISLDPMAIQLMVIVEASEHEARQAAIRQMDNAFPSDRWTIRAN